MAFRLLALAILSASTAAARHGSIHEHVTARIVHAGAMHGESRAEWDRAALTIEQPLDHFDALSTATWKMRYWVDNSSWDGRPSAPALLGMGGEGASSHGLC